MNLGIQVDMTLVYVCIVIVGSIIGAAQAYHRKD